MKRTTACLGCVIGLLLAAAIARGADAPGGKEKLPDGAQIVSLSIEPAAIDLANKYVYSQVVVSAKLATGETIDVTRAADAALSADVASVSPTGVVRPKADGQAQLTFSVGGQSVQTAVSVHGLPAPYETSFVRDVMPTMSKLGCNAGTCHGSLNGKSGFKLSLRGYDPLFDHRALTDDIEGRRFNRAAPDQSLMLLKPAGVIPHVGGALMQPGEPYYELLRSWIAAGVKLDLASPRVAKIDIAPKNPIVPLPGMTQQMRVMATYTDGAVRDVTLEAFIDSGNTEVAENNKLGLVKMVRRGEAPVLARFEGAYTATTITVMGDRGGYQWQPAPVNNYVDELVDAKLQRVKALPSPLCTDAEFVRRVYLDLVGLPPTADEVRAFLADGRETKLKRDELIDRLIGCPDFVEHWTNKWGDLLMVNRKYLGESGAAALRAWIRQAVETNVPYDKFAYAVVTASGSTMQNPPAAYYKVHRTPEALMENTTQLFLAVRFNCNKCHDHPFERWTQNQYFHLSAFFAQVGRTEDPASGGQKVGGSDVDAATPLIEDIVDTGTGEMMHAGTGQPAAPEFPYTHADLAPPTAARREQLAKWLASKDNPYFAKSYVNRLWGYLFGKGIIDPIDDIRAGNPATNPELLDRLTNEFVASGFNTREVLRTICKSRTYQASIVTNQWNADDDVNFSHAVARRLPAEVMFDAIHRTTGAGSRLPGGTRAAQVTDVGVTAPGAFFELFGRPPRESSCECERSSGVMLGPVMALINGPTIADAVADPGNAIAQLVAAQPDDAKVVEDLYYRVFNRPPTADEIASGVAALGVQEDESPRFAAELAAYEASIDARQEAWEATQIPVIWTPLEAVELKSTAGATFAKQGDLSILVEGTNAKDVYTVVAHTDAVGISGIKLETLTDSRLPNNGPGRPANGNFVLSEFKVEGASKADPNQKAPLVLVNPTADFSQNGMPVQNSIDNNRDTGWAVDPQGGRDHYAVYEVQQDSGYAGGTVLTITLDQNFVGNDHQLGKFRLSATTSRRPIRAASPLPANINLILAVPRDQRTPEQRAELARYHRGLDAGYARVQQVAGAAQAQAANKRLTGAQDLTWALLNSPAFLFNH